MKRIRVHEFGDPGVLQLEGSDEPEPGTGQVVVRVRAAGVNPFDTYMRLGRYGQRNPSLPYTPGADAAGVIASIGQGVSGWGIGDRVYTSSTISGAYADMALCLESHVHRLPERFSFAQGAAIGVPYATAHRALFHVAKAQAGDVVLVHGASGGVGIAALQLTRLAGMTVFGTAGTEQGLDLIRQEGAHRAFHHGSARYLEEILEATEGRGVDVILEMLANVNLDYDLKLLAHHGRVVVIGSRGTIEIDPRGLMARDATVAGMIIWNMSEGEFGDVHAALRAGLESGALRPVVRLELPLASAPEAHQRVMAPGALGKIVLVP